MRTLAERSAQVLTESLDHEHREALAAWLTLESAPDLVVRPDWAPGVDQLVVGRAGVFLVAIPTVGCGRVPFGLRADLREQVRRARAALDARGLPAMPATAFVCSTEPLRAVADIVTGDADRAIRVMTVDRRFGVSTVSRAVEALAPAQVPPFVADVARPRTAAPQPRRRLLLRPRA